MALQIWASWVGPPGSRTCRTARETSKSAAVGPWPFWLKIYYLLPASSAKATNPAINDLGHGARGGRRRGERVGAVP
eukprot:106052-Pyramimonas_sp.AAC.1